VASYNISDLAIRHEFDVDDYFDAKGVTSIEELFGALLVDTSLSALFAYGVDKAVNYMIDSADTITRPSWQQTETDVGDMYPGYNSQESFLDGETVPYGTSGSSRPEYSTTGHSVEAKNYNIETASGRTNLVNNVSKQITERVKNLPANTKQTIVIDVRGQTYTQAILDEITKRILGKVSVEVEIKFIK